MERTVTHEDLDRIVLDTLSLFVGGNAVVDPDFESAGPWVASVTLAGPLGDAVVELRVEVVADGDAATCITGSMLGMSSELCDDDDVRDVLGEVANTVGGNVKACLGDGLQLSLPLVAPAGDGDGPETGAGEVQLSRGYRCDELGLQVLVRNVAVRP